MAAACLAPVALGAGVAAADAAREPRITAVRAKADAHVSAAMQRVNFGRTRRLTVDGRPVARTYLSFKVGDSGPDGQVRRVNLLLYTHTQSRLGFQVRLVIGDWGERRITFANAPRVSNRRVSSGPVRKGAWKAIDVTSLVGDLEDGDDVSLAVTTVGRGEIELASRESGLRGPRLVIEREIETPEIGGKDPLKS